MKQIEKHRCEDEFGTDLDVKTIQAKFFPWPRFKVAHRIHEAGSVHETSLREGRILVFSGQLTFRNSEHELRISGGECAEIPAGTYSVSVEGTGAADVAYVWDVESLE